MAPNVVNTVIIILVNLQPTVKYSCTYVVTCTAAAAFGTFCNCMVAFIFSCYKVWPFKQFPVHNCWSLHSSKMGLWSWQWLWWQFWWASELWYVNTVLYLFLILTAEGLFYVYLIISNYLFICGNLKVCFAEVDLKPKSLHGTLQYFKVCTVWF